MLPVVTWCHYMKRCRQKYHFQLWGMQPDCDHVPSPNIHLVRRVKVLHQSALSAGLPRGETSEASDSCWNWLLSAVMSCFLSWPLLKFFCLAVNPLVSEPARNFEGQYRSLAARRWKGASNRIQEVLESTDCLHPFIKASRLCERQQMWLKLCFLDLWASHFY